jgi:hypothetical protein
MPVWSWFFIAAAVLIMVTLVLIGVLSLTGRRKARRLKNRFGADYDPTVDEAGGQRTAEQELIARERKRRKLDTVELSPES